MDATVYTLIAKKMEEELTAKTVTFNIDDKLLFKKLYVAFCRHNPNFHLPSIDTIKTQKECQKAIGEMFNWYKRTYEKAFGAVSGLQGQQRTITATNVYDDKDDGFDTVYGFRTFVNRQIEPPNRDKDFRDFILHMAVAFAITPGDLDELLEFYTFRRLHAKNIHDLSIYATLSTLPYGQMDSNINPFDEVAKLYEEARTIVKNVRKGPNSERMAAALPTIFIRDSLMGNEVLTHERFIQFVETNKDAFNMRHSMLLQEYRKLSELFRYIYDNRHFKGAEDCWNEEINTYSWRSFLETFCIKSTNPTNRFRGQFDKIEKEGKHPTRESMIVLWIYAYAFASAHGVMLTEKMFDRICNSLKDRQTETDDTGPCWMAEAKGSFYKYNGCTSVFNIRKFYFHDSSFPKDSFSGKDLHVWLNERLQQFELGSLNANIKFDAVILQLCKVKISLYEQDRSEYLIQNARGLWYDGISMLSTGVKIHGVENVPYVLIAIVGILQKLKESDKPSLPLECKLYE